MTNDVNYMRVYTSMYCVFHIYVHTVYNYTHKSIRMLTFYRVFVTVWKSKVKTVSYNINSENITAAWERCLIEERIENLDQSHFFFIPE